MEWLRWILLAIGLVLIAAIYALGRRQESGSREPAPRGDPPQDPPPAAGSEPARGAAAPDPDPDPVPGTVGSDALPDADLSQFDALFAAAARHAPAGGADAGDRPVAAAAPQRPAPEKRVDPRADPERVIVLYVVAPRGERLVGAKLLAAFARHGLEHGELGAFHARRREAPGDEGTEFSVANVVEPGSFDPATMATLSTPGVVLFMRLPGPRSPATALDRMLATARALAEELGARVLDDNQAVLTRQAEQHLRDELQEAAPHRRPVRDSKGVGHER